MGRSQHKSRSRGRSHHRYGLQPSQGVPPPLPPYVFLTLKKDFNDLVWIEPARTPDWPFPRSVLHKGHDFMRHLVIHCVGFGSEPGVRSVLLPTCSSIGAAISWNKRAAASYRNNCGFMVRISTEKVGEDHMIDVSSEPAQKAFFRKACTVMMNLWPPTIVICKFPYLIERCSSCTVAQST